MKVALIQPPVGADYPPLSIGSLAAYVAREGHEPLVLDFQVPWQRARWRERLADFAPRVVGLTAMTPTIGAAARIAAECRRVLPDATMVLGGYHVSFLGELTLRQYPVFDLGVVGEGERTLTELLGAIEGGGSLEAVPGLLLRRGDEVLYTGQRERIRDLDSLPWPHDHYDLDYYLWYGGYSERWTFKCASAIVSRGCPFRCRFCASQRFWRKRFLLCSPERVVEEVRYLARRGARSIYFRDSTFTANRKWTREFCEAKIKPGVRTRWLCNTRADSIDEELLVLMKRAGLEALYFGVESGSQRILDYYNKATTVEQVRHAFDLCHKHGIATAAFFMIGAPIETRDDIRQSRDLARELRATYTYWFIYTPLPGSPLYEESLAEGEEPNFEDFVFNRARGPVGDMTAEELEATHRELVAEFERKRTRADVWRRRMEMLRSVRSLRDLCHFSRRFARKLGIIRSP